MNYKNGYKVVYEVAADGERTFWASKSNEYPARDEAGNIIENEMNTKLASFVDEDFAGKTIYEYKGEFYVSTDKVPAYNEDGTPKDTKIVGFEKLFVEDKPENVTPAATTVENGNAGEDDLGDDNLGDDDLGDEGTDE